MGAKGTPGTMNKEYQEATNEYLKVRTLSLLSPFLFAGFGVSGEERRGEEEKVWMEQGDHGIMGVERDRWECREGIGTTDLGYSS
jgi:hypothetical protein